MANWSRNFERAFDELFEALMPAQQRRAAAGQDALVRDCGGHYEIELAAAGIDPAELSVEVYRGEVLVSLSDGQAIGRFAFPTPIDADAVRAQWADGVLRIAAPKYQGRRVPVEKIR